MEEDNVGGKLPRTKFKKKTAGETGQSFGDLDQNQIYRGAGQWIDIRNYTGKDAANHIQKKHLGDVSYPIQPSKKETNIDSKNADNKLLNTKNLVCEVNTDKKIEQNNLQNDSSVEADTPPDRTS